MSDTHLPHLPGMSDTHLPHLPGCQTPHEKNGVASLFDVPHEKMVSLHFSMSAEI